MENSLSEPNFTGALIEFAVDYSNSTSKIPDFRHCPYIISRHHEYVVKADSDSNAAMALVYSYINSIYSSRLKTWTGQNVIDLSRECIKYLNIAYNFNHPHASFIVGRVYTEYFRVQGIDHNEVAVRFFERAALQGAMEAVAPCCNYYARKGTIRDKDSYRILLMGRNYKMEIACKTLGIVLYHGIEGVIERNRDKAFRYLNNLEAKDSEVITYLSFMYMCGHGVAINPEQSAKMIIQTAETNDLRALDILEKQAKTCTKAAFVLALIYQKGFSNTSGARALEINQEEAMKWFKKAVSLDPQNNFATKAIESTPAQGEDLGDLTISKLMLILKKLVNEERYQFYLNEFRRLSFIRDFEDILTHEYFEAISSLLKSEPSATIQNILPILENRKVEAKFLYEKALEIERALKDETAISKAFEEALSRGSIPSLLKMIERVINGKEKGKHLDWAYNALIMLSKFYCTEDMIDKGWMFFSKESDTIKVLYAALHKKLKGSSLVKEQAIFVTMNKGYEFFNRFETLINELEEMKDLKKIANISKSQWNLLISTLDFGAFMGNLRAQKQLIRLFSSFKELKIHFPFFWEKMRDRQIDSLINSIT